MMHMSYSEMAWHLQAMGGGLDRQDIFKGLYVGEKMRGGHWVGCVCGLRLLQNAVQQQRATSRGTNQWSNQWSCRLSICFMKN